jgi:hypothetical protein
MLESVDSPALVLVRGGDLASLVVPPLKDLPNLVKASRQSGCVEGAGKEVTTALSKQSIWHQLMFRNSERSKQIITDDTNTRLSKYLDDLRKCVGE